MLHLARAKLGIGLRCLKNEIFLFAKSPTQIGRKMLMTLDFVVPNLIVATARIPSEGEKNVGSMAEEGGCGKWAAKVLQVMAKDRGWPWRRCPWEEFEKLYAVVYLVPE